MPKRRPLAERRCPFLAKISTSLVKGYGASLLICVVTGVLLFICGFGGVAGVLLLAIAPFMIRVAIAISCTLLVTSFVEAI